MKRMTQAERDERNALVRKMMEEQKMSLGDVGKVFGVSGVAVYFWLHPEKRPRYKRRVNENKTENQIGEVS